VFFHHTWTPVYQLCEPMDIVSEIGVSCTTSSWLSNFRRDCNDPFDHMVLRLHLVEDIYWVFHHVALFTKCIESEKETSRKKGVGQLGIRTWEMDEEVSTRMGESENFCGFILRKIGTWCSTRCAGTMCEDRRQEGSKMCFTLGAPTSRNVMYKSKGKGKSPACHDKEDVRGRT